MEERALAAAEHGRVFSLLLQRRLDADYGVAPEFTAEGARLHPDQAGEFVADARALLADIIDSG